MFRNVVGSGGVSFLEKKRYKCVRFNVISVTRGWVRVKFPGKKRYVKIEWAPYDFNEQSHIYFELTHLLSITLSLSSSWAEWLAWTSLHQTLSINISRAVLSGFAKLKKFQKSKQILDRAQPTHPPPYPNIFFFGNPSVTRPEHSNHNGFSQLLIT